MIFRKSINFCGIKKDLRTLKLFKEVVGYERAIYLVYGDQNPRFVATIERTTQALRLASRIELWTHVQAGCRAEFKGFLNNLN